MNRRWVDIAGAAGGICLLFAAGFLVVRHEFTLYVWVNLFVGASGAGLFLARNVADMSRRFLSAGSPAARRWMAQTGVVLGALVLINLFGFLFYTGVDLTPDKTSSLSDQSQKAVQWIKEPVELLVFSTKKMSDSKRYLLESYAFINKNLSYRVVDPEKDPPLAQRYNVDQDGQVALVHKDGFYLIPGIDEQSVTNAILKLTQKAHNTVYFLAGHDEHDPKDLSTKDGYGLLAQQMAKENYEVRSLVLSPPHYYIPGDCTLLVVGGPRRALTSFEVAAVREYLGAAGRAIFLLDPQPVTGVEPLLRDWGIQARQDCMVDLMLPTLVQRAIARLRGINAPPRALLQVYINDFPPSPLSSTLEGKSCLFSVARSFEAVRSPSSVPVRFNVLAQTTDKGWAETDVEGLLEKGRVHKATEEKRGPFPVAVLSIRGTEADPSHIMAFGDSDFVNNEYVHQLHNLDLFMNSLAMMTEQTPLVSVRPRRLFASRLDIQPDTMTRIFTLSVLVFPQGLLMAGLAFWRWRR